MSLRSTIPIYTILLLGETGTGKSTLVNAIANYFTYKTLEEALDANEPRCVIPSTFEITLASFEQINFYLNGFNAADKGNENYSGSSSCTQDPRVYSFYNDEVGFNVIDIPGIGDTRGMLIDKRNKKIIADKLSQFTEIHGIFILLKASEPRLTPTMVYNLNETMMFFHNTAVPNIMFIITNSRGVDYNSGTCMRTLQDYVKQLKNKQGIEIPLNTDTVYCIDNEAYIFQCGWNKSEQYRREFGPIQHNYSHSWKVSRDVIFKVFQRMYTLLGHDVKLTCTVGQARTVIHCLIGPLATITTVIQQATLGAHRQKSIETLIKSGEKMEDTVEATKTRPQTVCTSAKCIEAVQDPNTGKFNFNFKTICHDECHLRNVPLARFPEPALEDCQAFDLDGNCFVCGCRVERHMHLKQRQHQRQISKKVSDKPMSVKEAEAFMDKFVQSQQTEQRKIISAIVQLSLYLRQNAILEYNNAFEERMNFEIRKEEAAIENGSHQSLEVIRKLQKTLDEYLNEMKAIEISIKNGNNKKVTEEDVDEIVKNLFTLPYNGANIRKLFNAESSECPTVPDIPALNLREVVSCKVNYMPSAVNRF